MTESLDHDMLVLLRRDVQSLTTMTERLVDQLDKIPPQFQTVALSVQLLTTQIAAVGVRIDRVLQTAERAEATAEIAKAQTLKNELTIAAAAAETKQTVTDTKRLLAVFGAIVLALAIRAATVYFLP